MNFSVPLPLVASGKLPTTNVTCKGLLARVRSDVGCQMVASAEIPHANPALEGLLTSVDADVPGQFIRPGESPVTRLHRASVWSFVRRGLARAVGVFPHSAWFHELGLVGGVDGLQILGTSLGCKGFDG